MLIIRPIAEHDLSALLEIAMESGIGFTSLPVDEKQLRHKLQRSVASFSKNVTEPHDEGYLLVAEDTDTGEIVGTTALEACVGQNDAFYHYHHTQVVHASPELNIHNKVGLLTLCNHYTGAAELCTLFLREKYRSGYNGRLLSKCRFLLLADHAERFGAPLIAEMRGVSDPQGRSPFWGWLEEHFFSMDFPTADYLSGIGNKLFIAELMPKYPIYTCLLTRQAQAVIGKVHQYTAPALRLLEKEGFRDRGYVDIFDAGPTVECELDNVRSVRASQRRPVAFSEHVSGELMMVSNTRLAGFRALLTEVEASSAGQALISPAAAEQLQLSEGDEIRFTPISH